MILNLSITISTTVERDGALWIQVLPVAGIAELRVHAGSVLLWKDGSPAARQALVPGRRLTVVGEDGDGRTLDVQRLVIELPSGRGHLTPAPARVPLTRRMRLALNAWPLRRPRQLAPFILRGAS